MRQTEPDSSRVALPPPVISAYVRSLVALRAAGPKVLEAQQQLYPAQTALAQIRRGPLVTHVRLYKALGGGWSLTDAQWSE